MNRKVTLVAVLAVLAVLIVMNVVWAWKEPGVLLSGTEIRDPANKGYPTGEEKVQIHTRNLSFEKEGRTLAAARNLGNMGAEAKSAIPRLEELIAVKTDSDGFPSDRQKEAYRDALTKIKAAVAEEEVGNVTKKP